MVDILEFVVDITLKWWNPGRFLAKIRVKSGRKSGQNLNFVMLSFFGDLGHVQRVILPFDKQLNNALNVH